jgi:hypothetical protein
VRLARLPRLTDNGFRAFVRFPAGWSRAELGHYAVAEEFLVLEGELCLNNATFRRHGFAYVPAFQPRSLLRSDAGCLVFAWFAGQPRWVPGVPNDPPGHADHASTMADGLFRRRFAAGLIETLDLRDRRWSAS